MRNKADILYENLMQTMETFSPGEQLPSVRQLMNRHAVCQQVVVQALDKIGKIWADYSPAGERNLSSRRSPARSVPARSGDSCLAGTTIFRI